MPYINRFLSADTLVPDPQNPQGWNRYTYTLNNPLKFVDPSGHCWSFASGLRNTFLGTTCNNMDMAWSIVTSPDASIGQRFGAATYLGVETVAAGTVAVGTTVVAVGCLTGAGTMVCAGAGSAATAASADGQPFNEAQAVAQALTADGDPGNEARLGLDAFSRASEFGIKTFNELGRLTRGTGLERHHIVEQRFADTLGITKPDNMPSVALTPQEHQVFTNAWRDAIAYSNSGKLPNTITATADDIWQAAQRIYRDYPILTEAARRTIFD